MNVFSRIAKGNKGATGNMATIRATKIFTGDLRLDEYLSTSFFVQSSYVMGTRAIPKSGNTYTFWKDDTVS